MIIPFARVMFAIASLSNSFRSGGALGRENYLFAGSHEAAAQQAAWIYSFFAICKKHVVSQPFTMAEIYRGKHHNNTTKT